MSSKYTEQLFATNWKNREEENIIDLYETMSHERFPSEAQPDRQFKLETDIWDLYIVTYCRVSRDKLSYNLYTYYHFHGWFNGELSATHKTSYRSHIAICFSQNVSPSPSLAPACADEPSPKRQMPTRSDEGLSQGLLKSYYADRVLILKQLEALKNLDYIETLPADEATAFLKMVLKPYVIPCVLETLTLSF